KQCKELIVAVYMKDLNSLIRIAADMTGGSYEKYNAALRADYAEYIRLSQNESLGYWFMSFANILVKHDIKFPLYLTTFGRTILVLEGLVKTYLPELTTLELFGEEIKRAVLRSLFKDVLEADWVQLAYALSRRVSKFPEDVSEFLYNPLRFVYSFVE